MQDAQVHEEAATQLLDGARMAEENEHYYTDLFMSDDQEQRSESFQVKDGINGGRIPKSWVLLDSQSTTDAFSNPHLLTDIHEVTRNIQVSRGP